MRMKEGNTSGERNVNNKFYVQLVAAQVSCVETSSLLVCSSGTGKAQVKSSQDNFYGRVVVAQSLREFTRFI